MTIKTDLTLDPAVANFDQLPDNAHARPIVCAQLLGISIATFWRLVKQGKLQTHKLTARTTTVKVADLRAFMAKGGCLIMAKKTKDTNKNKGAGAKATTPKDKTSKRNFNDNSAHNQRLKILDWLFEKGSITTAQAREHLDITSPAPRIMELRKAGYQIVTVWIVWVSEFDIKHRIGRYVLVQKEPVESDKKGGGDV